MTLVMNKPEQLAAAGDAWSPSFFQLEASR
jgi:hypothetical protein